MSTQWDFFIAHASVDKPYAELLYEELRHKARVFLDSKSLRLGDDWDQAIQNAQRASAITVVIVTNNFNRAYYQREEIATSINMARLDPDSHRVVPIFFQTLKSNNDVVPYGLRLKHGIEIGDLSQISSAASQLTDLLASLRYNRNSAFIYGLNAYQFTNPGLTARERTILVDSLQKLTGLPGAWYLVPESLSNVEDLLKLAERLDPNHESELRKSLHAGMRLMSLGNVLGQKGRVNEANFQDAFSSFLDALRELAPPAQLSRTVEKIILSAKREPRPDDVVLEKVPPLVCAWLKAESAGSFSLQEAHRLTNCATALRPYRGSFLTTYTKLLFRLA